MVLSGFAGLCYQMIWTQQFSVWLGHEIIALLAVVAAFFGGLALGALALDRRISSSINPARWYTGCELLIAVWGLVLIVIVDPANAWLASFTGAQPSALWQGTVAFVGTFVLLLPATAAMGATLPAMQSVTERLTSHGYAIAGLYAANTFGAVLGVLATAFALVPSIGLANTALIAVTVNLLCALMAFWWLARAPALARTLASDAASKINPQVLPPIKPMHNTDQKAKLNITLFATGLLGIGYEVVVVRILSQVTENTVYSFAMLLAVYLIATALGAAAYQRQAERQEDHRDLGHWRNRLLRGLALAILLGAFALWQCDAIKIFVSSASGETVASAIVVELVLAMAAFAIPAFCMGALFSHLCVEYKRVEDNNTHGIGGALGINTLGAAIAPWLVGVILFPVLGPKLLLVSIASVYLIFAFFSTPSAPVRPLLYVPVLVGLGIMVFAKPLMFVDVPDGGRVVSYQDGIAASVSVVEDASGVARLRINNRAQEGSSASALTDSRLAYIPLLLHPSPKSALFLGLGTGVTAFAGAGFQNALTVDAVELLPEVIRASTYFTMLNGGDRFGTNKPNIIIGDARRYVRASQGNNQQYDVIVADLFHPARSGAGALYTVEHFAAINARLADQGLFCQWLPLHQLDLPTLRSIVKSFMTVYHNASAVLATNSLETPVLGLIALRAGHGGRAQLVQADGAGPALFDVATLRERLADHAAQLKPARLADEFALLGNFVAGAKSLRAFSAAAALNTDDRPWVAHHAPYATYAPQEPVSMRLLGLLHALNVQPDELLGVPTADDAAAREWQQRLRNYWLARDQFIEAGVGVRPSNDARAMLAQVQVPLLKIVRTSGDFTAAYDPLLGMALALGRSDVVADKMAANKLLSDLIQAQPTRPDASMALKELLNRESKQISQPSP